MFKLLLNLNVATKVKHFIRQNKLGMQAYSSAKSAAINTLASDNRPSVIW